MRDERSAISYLLLIKVTHSVDHIGVRSADDGFGTKAILPDGKDMGTLAELRFRALLHRPQGGSRQGPDDDLTSALEEDFVVQAVGGFLGGVALREGKTAQVLPMVVLRLRRPTRKSWR